MERKPALIDRIAPNKSSFIPGRKIHRSVIIAKELDHSMTRIRGKCGFMGIKIDFEKADDRLRCGFIRECLLEFSLTPHIVEIIMACVSSASYNVLWNGGVTKGFLPSRGIR